MIVAIGDIHAFESKMFDLLDKLMRKGIDFNTTPFVFLGDYVDGGDNAKGVLDFLMEADQKYPHWQFLMGNHEDMMIACTGYAPSVCAFDHGTRGYTNEYYLWYYQGGHETLNSFIDDRDLTDYERALVGVHDVVDSKYFEWMKSRPLTFETDQYIFVHAGLRPNGITTNADKLWIRDEFIRSDHDFGKRVIFGHTYQYNGPLVQANKIGIDTMHHGGGVLTAAIIHDNGDVEFEHSFETERTH
jgi:serine/threonine protein phosphatase 1